MTKWSWNFPNVFCFLCEREGRIIFKELGRKKPWYKLWRLRKTMEGHRPRGRRSEKLAHFMENIWENTHACAHTHTQPSSWACHLSTAPNFSYLSLENIYTMSIHFKAFLYLWKNINATNRWILTDTGTCLGLLRKKEKSKPERVWNYICCITWQEIIYAVWQKVW